MDACAASKVCCLHAVGHITRVPSSRDYSSSEVLVHYMQQVHASSVLISAFRGLLWRLIARGSLLPSNMVAVQPCKVRASSGSNEVLRARE